MKHRILPIALAALFLTGIPKASSAPPLINYQGRVAVGTPAVNFEGTGRFKFALVNATGGVTYWSNDGSSVGGSQPAGSVPLTVTKGLYSVLLGETPLMNPLLGPSLFSQPDLRLRVWFSDGTPTGFQLLSPDQRLAPTAYLADGVVSSVHIADAAITSAKVADGAVVSAKIAPATITGDRLAPSTLTAGNLLTPTGGAAAGKILSFDGTNLLWAAPSGGGGIWALNGTNDAYYNGGKVGIGTPIPDFKLVVADAGVAQLGFSPTYGIRSGYLGNGTEYDGGDLQLQGGWSLYNGGRIRLGGNGRADADRNVVQFFQNNLERMRINDGGNVGVGTATPDFKLVVADAGVAQLGFSPTYGIRSGYLGNGTEFDGGDLQLQGGWALYNGGRIRLGGSGRGDADRNVIQFFQNSVERMRVNDGGNVGIGTATPAFKLDVNGDVRGTRLILRRDGATANAAVLCADAAVTNFVPYNTATSRPMNIVVRDAFVRQLTISGGADLAEPFDMKEDELDKGSVVVIDDEHPGRLKRSRSAYDTRVAGIISGANGIAPGIALHQEGVIEGGQNVALSGRVYVQADASSGSIKPGDLLTTSDTPGHAMKVTEPTRAQGAVIGKAMSSLAEGTGMVLVLVTLQ